MESLVSKVLIEVDPDIRAEMEADAGDDVALQFGRRVKVWEIIPDPLFFIIKWQELRYENQHKQKGTHSQR